MTHPKKVALFLLTMKAMILAAGKGTRLRPLTKDKPKPMIQIAEKPVLEYNIRLLSQHGVNNLVVNLHHHPDVIKDYFGNGSQWGVSISYSYESALMGTAGAVKKVESLFSSTFVVFYGDNLTNCDIEQVINFHKRRGGVATLALFNRENPTESGIVEFNEKNRISRFVEKPKPEKVFSNWVNAGIMVLEPEVLDYIPESEPCDFGRDVLPNLLKNNKELFGYRMDGSLWWIDTIKDYQHVKKMAKEGGLDLP